MTLLLALLDVARAAVVGVLFAAVAWGFLRVLGETPRLDDPGVAWPESPGFKTDRAALLGRCPCPDPTCDGSAYDGAGRPKK